MFSKHSFVMLFVIAALVGLPNFAAAEVKIAVVDIQKVMAKSTAATSARAQLKEKQKQFQQQLNQKESALQKKDQELGKQRGVISKEAFQKQVVSFRKEAAAAQKEVQKKRLQLNKAFDASLATIQKNVLSIVSDIAKQKGVALVVPASQTLYFTTPLDISAEVLAQLNKKLPKLSVKF